MTKLRLLGALTLVLASASVATAAVPASVQRRANHEVARAKKQGGLDALIRRMERRSARAADGQDGPSIDQQALAIAFYNDGGDTGSSPMVPAPTTAVSTNARHRAHAAGCWSGAGSHWHHSIAGGAWVARMDVTNSGWCGNGTSITSGASMNDHHWAQYPYCLTDISTHQGWDGSRRWYHGGEWSTTGIYTVAFVCAPILGSQHATLRIAANGYWDRYDDFGF